MRGYWSLQAAPLGVACQSRQYALDNGWNTRIITMPALTRTRTQAMIMPTTIGTSMQEVQG